jgi:hypothetical protein
MGWLISSFLVFLGSFAFCLYLDSLVDRRGPKKTSKETCYRNSLQHKSDRSFGILVLKVVESVKDPAWHPEIPRRRT